MCTKTACGSDKDPLANRAAQSDEQTNQRPATKRHRPVQQFSIRLLLEMEEWASPSRLHVRSMAASDSAGAGKSHDGLNEASRLVSDGVGGGIRINPVHPFDAFPAWGSPNVGARIDGYPVRE
jgi:hypothetical protein